ncbi:MAG: autoinducer binding domain-containing protein [Litorimonas sp.]
MRIKLEAVTLDAIADSETVESAFRNVVDCAGRFGIDLVSYHRFDPLQVRPGVPRHSQFELLSSGFPEDWVQRYLDSDYRLIDPITGLSACLVRPILWSSVPSRTQLTPAQSAYMDDLFSWLAPGDGLAVPLFGPNGQHGYAGMGWRQAGLDWDSSEVRVIQAVAESFHLRVCELTLEERGHIPTLTGTQERLLRALAGGHPDAMICGMVNLRPEALQTAIARLLGTLGVSDRPSALIRAEALGLIDRRLRA